MQKGAIVYAATASVVTGVALAYAACADSNAPSANRRWEASLAKGGSEIKVKSLSVLPSTATVMAGSTVRLTATANPPGPEVLIGAGDIAVCGSTGDEATSAILVSTIGPVFTLDDNAYPSGTAADYANCYDGSWGRVKARTMPAPGNHEYRTSGAAAYFGAAAGDPSKGYYSYDLGAWHIVVLNSNSE